MKTTIQHEGEQLWRAKPFLLARYYSGKITFEEFIERYEKVVRADERTKATKSLPPPPQNEAGTAKMLSLNQLESILRSRFGEDFTVHKIESGDGSSECALTVGDNVRARWKSRLVKPAPFDGRTPRGPSEYYDLKFIEAAPAIAAPTPDLRGTIERALKEHCQYGIGYAGNADPMDIIGFTNLTDRLCTALASFVPKQP